MKPTWIVHAPGAERRYFDTEREAKSYKAAQAITSALVYRGPDVAEEEAS